MYVTKKDYKRRISPALLDLLIQNSVDGDNTEENILADNSKIAEDAIASSAGVLYDVHSELAKQGADRNYYILNLAVSIALYNIYQNADDDDIPQKVIKNHDDAMTDLQAISKGKNSIDLPPRPKDQVPPTDPSTSGPETPNIDGNGLRRFGSNPKRSHMP